MQPDSEEELIPHVPTSSGPGSSELYSTLTEKMMNQKTLRGRGSTTIRKPTLFLMRHMGHSCKYWILHGSERYRRKPCPSWARKRDLQTIQQMWILSSDKNHVDRLCKNMTDDDRARLVLYSSKQESLKASSTSALIGKKRKEATATETKAYQKQFLEAKLLVQILA